MLFADRAVARLLNDEFECAWQSLRPVPKVHVDFGNGRTLDRTLNGNIAFWFVTQDGLAIDLIAGLIEPEAFRGRCADVALLHAQLRDVTASGSPGGRMAQQSLVAAHQQLKLASWGLAPSYLAPSYVVGNAPMLARHRAFSKGRVETPLKEALAAGSRPVDERDLSKSEVEMPMKEALAESVGASSTAVAASTAQQPSHQPPPQPSAARDPSKTLVEVPMKDALAASSGGPDWPVWMAGGGGNTPADPRLAFLHGSAPRIEGDHSKFRIERPLKAAVASDPTSSLAAETSYNRSVRDPQVARLLLQSPLARPADLTGHVYREILGVDLEDPYLGLAPYLLGGELGRDGHGVTH